MKRYTKAISLLLVFAAAFMLAGCGASAKYENSAPAAAPAAAADYGMWEAAEEDYAYEMEAPAAMVTGSGNYSSAAEPKDMSEKIIYSADVTLETTEFDKALEAVNALVSELGGYMESTGIYGNNYYSISRGYNDNRSANYTIRIPCEHFATLTGRLSEIGNIPSCSTYSNNVTMEYYDIQSRLNAYKTQETRLLEMLAIAESVEDMLSIQQQLTEVQYEIDSLTGSLRYYDNKVSYSTVNLHVSEVTEYTPEPTVKLNYAQKMLRNLKSSLKGIGSFFSDLGLWLVAALPVLAVLAIIAFAVILLVRRIRRTKGDRISRKAKKAAEKSVTEEKNE